MPNAGFLVSSVLLHRHRRQNCNNRERTKQKLHLKIEIQRKPYAEGKKTNNRALTEMIRTDLKRLGLPHEKPNLAGNLMLQELHGAGASLLPLVPILVKPVQFRFAVNKPRRSVDQ